MCRLLGYLGTPRLLQDLIETPPHSLIVQSYCPREMTAGLLNADGFGIAWYDQLRSTQPFLYRSILPIWSDINLSHIDRYVVSGCFLASIRSATIGQAVDFSNCQPFSYQNYTAIHNGFIENFRSSLYRALRSFLKDEFYQLVCGSTDSEHIFALIMQHYSQGLSLLEAIRETLQILIDLSHQYQVRSALNTIVTDGEILVASRCATTSPQPSLYWLQKEQGVIIASEPLWEDPSWQALPENSLLVVDRDWQVQSLELHL